MLGYVILLTLISVMSIGYIYHRGDGWLNLNQGNIQLGADIIVGLMALPYVTFGLIFSCVLWFIWWPISRIGE